MKITIAIPTYCRPDSVARLLRSLSEQVRMPDEVLVVDSSPDTKTAAVVESFSAASGFTVRYMQHEKGLTRQRNRAIRESSGDVVVFFDDDLVLEPDFLKEIERAFQEHRDVAGIGGFIVNEWGKRIDRFWKVRRLLGLLPGSYREGRVLPYGVALPLSTLQTFTGIKAVDWLPGCAFALRREVFLRHQFSTFFEGYGLAEDKQFTIRVSRGEKLAICGDARAHHLHVHGGRPNRFWMGYYHVRNHSYLLATCFPQRPVWRHWQLLWYWTVEAAFRLVVGTLLGQGKVTIPTALGLLWGVATHMVYTSPQQTAAKLTSLGEVKELL